MCKTLRRVLMVLLLLIGSMPWLHRPTHVLAQDEPEPAADTNPADTNNNNNNNSNENAAPTTAPGMTVPSGGLIAVVEFKEGLFYKYQLESVQRRTDRAINDGADLVVFELDTPGGDLLLAVEFAKYIRTLPVPTVAWVNDQALSAGILIASACDELVMARASLTGDCGPIVPGRTMGSSERAKALSVLLAEFRANAQANYAGPTTTDYALFNAMCVLGIDVYEVRHKLTGEVRRVSKADYAVMVDGVSPIDAADIGPSRSGSALVDPESGEDLGRPSVTVTQAEMGQWEFVRQIHNGSDFLTLNEKEALDVGLSRQTVNNTAELKQLYGAATVERYDETWSESLVGFLVHPVVRGALLLLGIAGLLLEYLSPGLILPGLVGIAAIVVCIGAPFLVGLAQSWHLVLIVVGVGLVIYELFTMTTFGVLAVVGLLMFLIGLVLSGVQTASNGLPAPGAGRQIVVSSMSFLGAMVLSIPLLVLLTRYFGSLPLLNKLILTDTPEDHGAMPSHPGAGNSYDMSWVGVGTTGVVTRTGLRPAGRIEVGDELVDVTSTGGFIEPGTTVRVVEVHGNMISVERADQPAD